MASPSGVEVVDLDTARRTRVASGPTRGAVSLEAGRVVVFDGRVIDLPTARVLGVAPPGALRLAPDGWLLVPAVAATDPSAVAVGPVRWLAPR